MASESVRQLVESTAHALRELQRQLATKPAEVREQHLLGVVDHATDSLTPAAREEFLESLSSRFPSWDAELDAPAPRRGPPDDALALADRLAEQLKHASVGERNAVIERLTESGVRLETPRETHRDPRTESMRALCELLGVESVERLDVDRLMATWVAMAETLLTLDRAARKAWQATKRDTRVTLPDNLDGLLRGDAEGAASVGTGQVRERLRDLLCLVAPMMEALSRVHREVNNALEPLHPRQIEESANAQRGGRMFGKSVGDRCWEEYRRLWEQASVGVETSVRNGSARFVEEKWHTFRKRRA